jgi:hypothetical protein
MLVQQVIDSVETRRQFGSIDCSEYVRSSVPHYGGDGPSPFFIFSCALLYSKCFCLYFLECQLLYGTKKCRPDYNPQDIPPLPAEKSFRVKAVSKICLLMTRCSIPYNLSKLSSSTDRFFCRTAASSKPSACDVLEHDTHHADSIGIRKFMPRSQVIRFIPSFLRPF